MNSMRTSTSNQPQFRLRSLLIVITSLAIPLAMMRTGPVLSAACLLYAAVVLPVLILICQHRLKRLEASLRDQT